jgi:hypothetical protein
MGKNRLFLYAILLALSVGVALPLVSIYGAWQHQRYWDGTIEKVELRQVALTKSMFDGITAARLSELTPSQLYEMLTPLHYHFAVQVSVNGNVVHDSTGPDRTVEAVAYSLEIPQNKVVSISTYVPPKWTSNLGKWLKRPTEWFAHRFDFITMPFLFFVLIIFCGLLAFVWHYRARHLEGHVIPMLEELRSNGDSSGS